MTEIAVLGMGLMGRAALTRLQDFFPTSGWNRSSVKQASFNSDDQIIECLQKATHALLFVSDAPAIDQILDKAEAQIADKVWIQMGTIAPQQSQVIAARIEQRGGRYIEAPVLGSIPQLHTGTLQIFAGGDAVLVDEQRGLLSRMGAVVHIGDIGQAAALKLAMNQLIAGLTTSFSASLGLIQQAGVDVNLFMDCLRDSAVYAPTFDKKLDKMLARNFQNPNFSLQHLLKDMRLFAEATPDQYAAISTAMISMLEQGAQSGEAANDYSSLYNVMVPVKE